MVRLPWLPAIVLVLVSEFPHGVPNAMAQGYRIDSQPHDITGLLNPDGTLDPALRFDGAIALRGWTMSIGSDGRPRFFRSGDNMSAVTEDQSDTGDVHWDARFSGPPGIDGGIVYAAARIGSDIYFGGSFWGAGGISSPGIIRWNSTSSTWSNVGGGIIGSVFALAVQNSVLYAGGMFTTAGRTPVHNIARWNGTSWMPLGSPPNDGVSGQAQVNSLASMDSVLYVGGNFTSVGNGIQANYVARWDGTSWSSVSAPLNSAVESMVVWGPDLYVGGSFMTTTPPYLNHIARWDGGQWSSLGTYPDEGVDNDVLALTVLGSSLYVGGTFTTRGRGADTANAILRWDGSAWNQVGPGFRHGAVRAFAVSGDSLYACGSLDTCGTLKVNGIACWDTARATWSTLNKGIHVPRLVATLLIDRDLLYAAGVFGAITNTTDIPANNVATWDGGTWSPLGASAFNSVNYPFVLSLVAFGNDLYIGGYFSLEGPVHANNIVRYTPQTNTWTSLGIGASNGVNGPAVAMGVSPTGDLYVGGNFSLAGGLAVHGVARWAGNSWSSLGTSPNDGVTGGFAPIVSAITFSGSSVYVGGAFDTVGGAGGISASNIARWDGTTWHTLGNGIAGTVSALKVFHNDLIAAGSFTQAGGTVANNIARWDGASWHALGPATQPGLNDIVLDLETIGRTLFVGGQFTQTESGTSVNGIASWDGTSFATLGDGLNGIVRSLVSSGGSLYAGGVFSSSGILEVNNIARWDTASGTWFNLGSGISGLAVNALTATPMDVFAGGEFFQAGNKPAYCLAHWTPALIGASVASDPGIADKFSLEQNFPNPFNPSTVIRYTITGTRGSVSPSAGRNHVSNRVRDGQGTGNSDVRLVVYDILGREVAMLVNEKQAPGTYEITFNGGNHSSGAYFYRLTAGNSAASRTMLLVK